MIKMKRVFGTVVGVLLSVGLMRIVPCSAGTGVWVVGTISAVAAGVLFAVSGFIDTA